MGNMVERFVYASGITDDKRKRALLLYMTGSRGREIFSTLTDSGVDFARAEAKLEEYFAPQKNKRYEIFKFRQMKQQPDESLDSFHTRLRTAANSCEFHETELEIEQQIIVGGISSTIRKKALPKPDYSLKDMLVDGRGKEVSLFQAKDIEGNFKEETMEKVSSPELKKCFNGGIPIPVLLKGSNVTCVLNIITFHHAVDRKITKHFENRTKYQRVPS